MPDLASSPSAELPAPLDRLFQALRRARAISQPAKFIAGTVLGTGAAGAIGASFGWQNAALSLLGVAGALAYKLWLDRDERGRLALMDSPGGRKVTANVLEQVDLGAVGIARGHAWAVFESPGAEPRVMSERAYREFRKTLPRVVEIDATNGIIGIGRYTDGLLDSVATGLPAIEMYDPQGRRRQTAWCIDGRDVPMAEVIQARLALENEGATATPSP